MYSEGSSLLSDIEVEVAFPVLAPNSIQIRLFGAKTRGG